MKLENAKIRERSLNNEAVRIQKRNDKIIFFIIISFFSYSLYTLFFNFKNKKDTHIFVNPFTNYDYLASYWYLVLGMFLSTVLIYLFHFGNSKRKYLHKLENAKQFLFDLLPFWLDGKDERNLYFRFGLQHSLTNGFLMRKVTRKDYLKKVSHLKHFVGKYSPHAFFTVNGKVLNLSKYFHSENDYLELFKIIEGYLTSNVDIFQNTPLKDYQAIGTYNPKFTKESFMYYLKNGKIQDEKILKRCKLRFKDINENKLLSKKQKQLKIKQLIEKELGGEVAFNDYKISIYKMVSFSVLAIQELLEKIYIETREFYLKNKLLQGKCYKNMRAYGEIDDEKLEIMLDYIVFCYFFKIINYFMGLPSGIVTARIKDYSFARVVDDFEHFEASRGIRLIKKRKNDKNSKFNDTFAHVFMILFHEYRMNSKHREDLETLLLKFNPLLTFEVLATTQTASATFGEKPTLDYVPTFYNLEEAELKSKNEDKKRANI